MKKTLILIAVYFLIESFFGFYQLPTTQGLEEIYQNHLNLLLSSCGFSIAGIGLILKKGWGRNFALFFNALYLINAAIHFINIGYVAENEKIFYLLKGSTSLIIAGFIYYYLMKKEIKKMFSQSPTSWSILGVSLVLYTLNQDSKDIVISTFWSIMMIVGIAISGYGAKQMKTSNIE